MRILAVEALALADVQVIRFGRFADERGYFSEHFRYSDFEQQLPFLAGARFVQCNESYSRPGTLRGLHFQWNPYVGKLVRTIHGHMLDLVLDIRKGSPTHGKIIAHDMSADHDRPDSQWIWAPPGFAHGGLFLKETTIEYHCTGEYNPACEASISPLAADLDWSLCRPDLKRMFDALAFPTALMSPKDRAGMTLAAWDADDRSQQFAYRAPRERRLAG